MIKLSNIELFFKDMMMKGENRVIFDFRYRDRSFSCLFLSDVVPMKLYLSTQGIQPFLFKWSLSEDFCIETNLIRTTILNWFNIWN